MTIGIVRAQRLANDDECAYAWRTLMSSTNPSTDEALLHAAQCLCDRVQYRMDNHPETITEDT